MIPKGFICFASDTFDSGERCWTSGLGAGSSLFTARIVLPMLIDLQVCTNPELQGNTCGIPEDFNSQETLGFCGASTKKGANCHGEISFFKYEDTSPTEPSTLLRHRPGDPGLSKVCVCVCLSLLYSVCACREGETLLVVER